MPFIRDFPVFKRRMHQVHEFAFVLIPVFVNQRQRGGVSLL
jgi:hypothetical protein